MMFHSWGAGLKLAYAAAGRGLAMLSKCGPPFPFMSVLENQEPCAYHGKARAQIKHHLDDVMEAFLILLEHSVRNALQTSQRGDINQRGHRLKTGSARQSQHSYMGL